MDEMQLPLIEQVAIRVLRRDHGEFLPIEGEVPFEQRQRAFADRAKADHHDRTVETRMQGPGGIGFGHCMHGCSFSRSGPPRHVSHGAVRCEMSSAAQSR
jgi:hypothetical protein